MNQFIEMEQLVNRLVDSRIAWDGSERAIKQPNSYFGIWETMNNSRAFYANERNDLETQYKEMLDKYNPNRVAEYKRKGMDEFDKTLAVATHKFRTMITNFTESKHKEVTKMLRTAPTESMKNLLETLKMRDDLDAVELHDILPLCYENYHALRALQVISRQNGVTLTVPVQMDCATMHKTIDEAKDYLIGACDEMYKPQDKLSIKYHAFFCVNPDEKGKVLDPVYQHMIDVLDYIPQLQDIATTKTSLNQLETIKVDWLYRNLPEKSSKTQIAQYTKEVMKTHPNEVEILKMSPYAEYVGIVEATHN